MNVFLNAWNRAIYGLIFADFMCFFAIGLFTDAEVPEDVVEGVLRGDGLAEDGIESLDNGTEIFGNEVAAFVTIAGVHL